MAIDGDFAVWMAQFSDREAYVYVIADWKKQQIRGTYNIAKLNLDNIAMILRYKIRIRTRRNTGSRLKQELTASAPFIYSL